MKEAKIILYITALISFIFGFIVGKDYIKILNWFKQKR